MRRSFQTVSLGNLVNRAAAPSSEYLRMPNKTSLRQLRVDLGHAVRSAPIGAFAFPEASSKKCEGSPPGYLLGLLSFQAAHVAQHHKRLNSDTKAHRSYQPLEALFIHPLPCRL